jgi:predicted DNA-binding transcriptional regulator AlpA
MSPTPSGSVGSIIRNETESRRSPRATAHLIRIPEAAEITGLPASLLRKSFMREGKRPRNVPPPPPHKRIGRAVYILADELLAWIEGLGRSADIGPREKLRRGRPTVTERINRRPSAS